MAAALASASRSRARAQPENATGACASRCRGAATSGNTDERAPKPRGACDQAHLADNGARSPPSCAPFALRSGSAREDHRPMQTKVITAIAAGAIRDVAGALADDVRAEAGGEKPSLILAFASPKQPLSELLPELRERLGDVPLLASSSAGEFTEHG